MQTPLDPPKRKPARKTAKRRDKLALPADEYLRLDPANEKAITDSIKAANRGDLVAFDPRKR